MNKMQTHYKRQGVNGDLNSSEISLSTKLILETAKEYGIKCERIPYTGLFLLKYKGKSTYLRAQPPTGNDRTAIFCCKNKAVTKTFLASKNISVPKGFVIQKSDKISYWKSVYNSLKKPIVVKPTNSSLALNVHANITNTKDFIKATKDAFGFYGKLNQDLLVEEMFEGTEYRIIATRNKVVGIMARIPANVIGDGIHTIKQLVDLKNLHPWRGGEYDLHSIVLGKKEKKYLKEAGLNINSIPKNKEQVFLLSSSTTNIDHGGDTIDLTNKVHSSVSKIAINAIRAIPGLEWGGIDFFSKDITKLQNPSDYIVLEINSSPNISWQEFPAVGKRQNIALTCLKEIFPNLNQTARPISKPSKFTKKKISPSFTTWPPQL